MSNKAPKKTTVGKVVTKFKPLTKSEIIGDRGVEDFLKWLRTFGLNHTGHFVDYEACDNFLDAVRGYFKEHKKVNVRTADRFITWMNTFSYNSAGIFVSNAALSDFARQVENYIATDGYIGNDDAL